MTYAVPATRAGIRRSFLWLAVVALSASLATPTRAFSGETIAFCSGLASRPVFELTTTEGAREKLENALAAMTYRNHGGHPARQ